MLATRAADASAAIVWTNQIGGQDELVFDGASVIIDPTGTVVARSPQFREDVLVHDLELRPQWRKRQLDPRGRPRPPIRPVIRSDRPGRARRPQPETGGGGARCSRTRPRSTPPSSRAPATTSARTASPTSSSASPVASTRRSCTAIAADAIGADHVHAIALPSRYSSEHARSDADAAVRRTSASSSTRSPSSPPSRPCSTCSPPASRAPSPTSPRRTSRAASGPRCSCRWPTSSGAGWW